jgi:hypothetical protein
MSVESPSGRLRDADPPAEVDAGPLLGTWLNTHRASGQIAGVRVEPSEGLPSLAAWGVDRPTCRDWGSSPIDRLYRGNPASPQAAAFVAHREFGGLAARIEANVSKGLMIIACMKTFRDGSGRSDYFVREFFRRSDGTGEATPDLVAVAVAGGGRPVTCVDDEPARGAGAGAAGASRLDPALFVGRWANTDAGTRGIREAVFREEGGGLRLELRPSDAAPGVVAGGEVRPFAEHPASTAATQFHTTVELPDAVLTMHGWVKLGVLVIAIFRHRAGPDGPAPTFDREFFYLAGPP